MHNRNPRISGKRAANSSPGWRSLPLISQALRLHFHASASRGVPAPGLPPLHLSRSDDGEHVLSRMKLSAARIEGLVNAITTRTATATSTSTTSTSTSNPTPKQVQPSTLWAELLSSLDCFLGAAAEVRACATLVQSYSSSRANLEAAVRLLSQAASLEDTVLRSPPVFTALQPPPDTRFEPDPNHSPKPRSPQQPTSHSSGATLPRQPSPPDGLAILSDGPAVAQTGSRGGGGDAASRGGGSGGKDGYSDMAAQAWRLYAALAPRFLREGYHPTDPRVTYSVALSRQDKEALLTDARRRERRALAALRQLLGCLDLGADGAGDDGIDAAGAVWNLDPAAAAAAGGNGGGGLASYEWPSYILTADELAEDAVLAEVAAAQWEGRRGDVGPAAAQETNEDDDGGGGGSLVVLTLDACGALLQRHPDPVLRRQVYDEGLTPLADRALTLMHTVSDLRAKQAALYGLYDGEETGATLYGSGSGFCGLAHADTLARDGRAAAAFLTSLAEALEPLVSEQLRYLASASTDAVHTSGSGSSSPSPSGPLDCGSFEYLMRARAWGPTSTTTGELPAGEGRGAGGAAAAGTWTNGGPARQDACACATGAVSPEAGSPWSSPAAASSTTPRYPDPAAPYLTDLGALLAGVSDWLAELLGVRLSRPRNGGVGGGVSGGSMATASTQSTDLLPYDVGVMLRELRRCYYCAEADEGGVSIGFSGGGHGGTRGPAGSIGTGGSVGGDGNGPGAAAAVGPDRSAAGDGRSGELESEVALILAAVAESAAAEPQRFLAYRLRVEGEGSGEAAPENVTPPGTSLLASSSWPPSSASSSTSAFSSPFSSPSFASSFSPATPITRWLLLDRCSGSGTRYLLPPLRDSADGRLGTRGVAAVVVGLQSGGGGGGGGQVLTRGSEFVVWELLHELGHAVHFLLAAAPPLPPPAPPPPLPPRKASDSAGAGASAAAPPPNHRAAPDSAEPQPQVQRLRRLNHSLLPYQLPLELVELPSSLLERGAAEEDVVRVCLRHCRHALTGQQPPEDVCRALAHAVHWSYYSPITVQIQVLVSLLDQLMMMMPQPHRPTRGSHGAAAGRLWARLLATFAPSLPVGCCVQQLQSLVRIASAAGQGYAYVTAAYLADELWGLMGGCGAGAGASAEAAVDAHAAGFEGATWGLRPAAGGCHPGGRRQKGRLVRRLLFERDASVPPGALLEGLLQELRGKAGSAGGGGDEGGKGGSMIVTGLAAARAAGEREDGAAGSGGRSGVVIPVSEAAGPPLRLIRTAGGGCVPAACGSRVRRWTRWQRPVRS